MNRRASRSTEVGDEKSKTKVFLFLGVLAVVFAVVLSLIGLQWWLVALLTALGVLLNFVRVYSLGRIVVGKTWICPTCRMYFNFNTKEWYKFAFTPSINKSYMIRIRCPHCGNLGWCKKAL